MVKLYFRVANCASHSSFELGTRNFDLTGGRELYLNVVNLYSQYI